MDKDEILLNILKENIDFQRHQETQRMWTANIFIAIVVGTLAYLIRTDIENLPWFVPLAFLIISTLCLLVTLKLNRVFAKTQESIRNAFSDIGIFSKAKDGTTLSDNEKEAIWHRYMAGFHSKEARWRILRVRHLYLVLYAIAMAASLWLSVSALAD